MRVLISAYACEPNKGSEPGVGWNIAIHMAKYNEVWVLTRKNNQKIIEEELTKNPVRNLNFIYHDLPTWASFWKKGLKGVQIYYYLWQITAVNIVRHRHKEINFDVAQHLTFGKYWTPSSLFILKNTPFIWGSIGGGETYPLKFLTTLRIKDITYEIKRIVARSLGELDPSLKRTAKSSTVTLATTRETYEKLEKLGANNILLFPQGGVSNKELSYLLNSSKEKEIKEKIIFITIARPLGWKGIHLGILAFEKANIPDSEYWIISKPDESKWLKTFSSKLSVSKQVKFLGNLPSLEDVHQKLVEADVLVHPALHEAFGMVVLEAQAVGRPVICLDLGGPSVIVTQDTGFRVPPDTPAQVINDMASAMHTLATDKILYNKMSQSAQARVKEHFTWDKRVLELCGIYEKAISLKKKISKNIHA